MTMQFGSLTQSENGFDLDFERVFASDIDDVWESVTTRERLGRWMAPFDGELQLGGTWRALNSDGSLFCTGTVTECEPPHRFVTVWHAVEESATTLTVTVESTPDGAKLRLLHEGVGSIDYGAGWQTYLEQLDDLLGAATTSVTDPSRAPGVECDARFEALMPIWEARFGEVRG